MGLPRLTIMMRLIIVLSQTAALIKSVYQAPRGLSTRQDVLPHSLRVLHTNRTHQAKAILKAKIILPCEFFLEMFCIGYL